MSIYSRGNGQTRVWKYNFSPFEKCTIGLGIREFEDTFDNFLYCSLAEHCITAYVFSNSHTQPIRILTPPDDAKRTCVSQMRQMMRGGGGNLESAASRPPTPFPSPSLHPCFRPPKRQLSRIRGHVHNFRVLRPLPPTLPRKVEKEGRNRETVLRNSSSVFMSPSSAPH